ncbi:hypothetical protein OAQ30_03565 [Nitrosopumilus sp.]|nr:hypothetical protein [Nitrosopumilus sp.]
MDETPEVSGDLILDKVCISNKNMIHDLEQKGLGEIENGKLFLQSFETLMEILLHYKKVVVMDLLKKKLTNVAIYLLKLVLRLENN